MFVSYNYGIEDPTCEFVVQIFQHTRDTEFSSASVLEMVDS